jgi:hypothetical protein
MEEADDTDIVLVLMYISVDGCSERIALHLFPIFIFCLCGSWWGGRELLIKNDSLQDQVSPRVGLSPQMMANASEEESDEMEAQDWEQ